MTEIKVTHMNLEEAVLTCLELSAALVEARRTARERSIELEAREREHSNALSTIHDQQATLTTLQSTILDQQATLESLQRDNKAHCERALSDTETISRLNHEIRVLAGRVADQTTMIEKLRVQISQDQSRKIVF